MVGILAAGCTTPLESQEKTRTIPQDTYVFVEHRINTNGTTVSGDCCGGNALDYPFYFFDEKNGVLTLRGRGKITVNESLKMVYGEGESLSGCAGGGAYIWASPVYALPYTQQMTNTQNNVTIETLSEDGTVVLRYGQKRISLKPEEMWSVNSTRYENVNRTYKDPGGRFYWINCSNEMVTTDRIYNAGILDKGTIVFT